MRRLDLPPEHLDFAVLTNEALGDVDRIAIVLRKSKEDTNSVLCRCPADSPHLGRVDLERVLDVFGPKNKVYRTGPGSILFS